MNFTKLPHDGEAIVSITGEKMVSALDRALVLKNKRQQELFDLMQSEVESLGIEDVTGYSMGTNRILTVLAQQPIPKSYRTRVQQLTYADKHLVRIARKQCTTSTRAALPYHVSFISVKNNKVTYELKPRPASPLYRLDYDEGPEADPRRTFNKLLKGYNLPDHAMGLRGGQTVIRNRYVRKLGGSWYGFFQIAKDEPCPKLKLPKGMQQIPLSVYWLARELAAMEG